MTKHKYINESLLWKYPKKISIEKIEDDLINKYKVTNINLDYELALYNISKALYDDIIYERCNYKAYIEEGMNARMMMALRTIAVLPLGEGFNTAYQECSTCETPKDVREVRIKYFKMLHPDYIDLDWQYFYMTKVILKRNGKDFAFDYETSYEDCNIDDQTNREMYRDSFMWNVLIPGAYELIYKDRDPWKAFIKC